MGETPDISDLLQFTFNEEVYYHTPGASYPASGEELGNFVGVADASGDELTFLVLSKNNQIMTRSVLRSAERTDTHNKRVAAIDGDLCGEKGGFKTILGTGILSSLHFLAQKKPLIFQ